LLRAFHFRRFTPPVFFSVISQFHDLFSDAIDIFCFFAIFQMHIDYIRMSLAADSFPSLPLMLMFAFFAYAQHVIYYAA